MTQKKKEKAQPKPGDRCTLTKEQKAAADIEGRKKSAEAKAAKAAKEGGGKK
eukprot:CAMPEP_0114570218 /NCGR_PEP_ID=MMETSP0114-20121206/17077_1 /TAXON_ID=31324 /ORGANISM="Goniomonas sp, Strain m" /LENGTH=51 /DNA_ID=CAMNT_0001757219 /DNA_START=20 /DNA_END=175 /DNA_ORIENTATION=+